MKVGLFIPCYINQFYPSVGVSTIQLLEKFGVQAEYPSAQTCCGQPMANAGYEKDCANVYQHFTDVFSSFDYIIAPSASCVYHVKKHYNIIDQSVGVEHVRNNIYELTDFLAKVLHIDEIGGKFKATVGLHISCHGQRGLRQITSSEISEHTTGHLINQLKSIQGLNLVSLNRADECCGFGGSFCVNEEAVSTRMGLDRIRDHENNGTQILTGTDMSCLMHLEGLIRRQNKNIGVMHVAEIFNQALHGTR
jgi:L-lactate dehydrogenase complex protein LldE